MLAYFFTYYLNEFQIKTIVIGKKKKLTPKWHHQGGKLEEGETRLTLLEDGDEELKHGENPEILQEPGLDHPPTPINTMGGYKKRQQRKKKQNKKTIFPTHGTDSAHHAPLFLVPDMTLKESNFSITEFPDHIVFPFGLLLKQLFTTSVNTWEKSVSIQPSYLDYVFPAFPHFVSLTQEKWYKF